MPAWESAPVLEDDEAPAWASAPFDDEPAQASLAAGFDADPRFADIGGEFNGTVGGLFDTEAITVPSAPILRALPVAPRQKVALDTQDVDPYQTRPEWQANLDDNGWEAETDPRAAYGVTQGPVDAALLQS